MEKGEDNSTNKISNHNLMYAQDQVTVTQTALKTDKDKRRLKFMTTNFHRNILKTTVTIQNQKIQIDYLI